MINRFTSVGVVAVASLLAACAGEPPEEYDAYEEIETLSQSVIIGDNDLVSVNADGSNLPARYRSLLGAIGRGVNNGALCTATHVGSGIVVSAGHCFGATATRVDHTSCDGAYVEFGYRNGVSASRSNCTEMLSKRTGGGYDYAIYRVSPIPSTAIPPETSARPALGRPLTILSHPGGRPLEWSKTCSVMSLTTFEFRYQCDTQGGSSGAAVLADDSLSVVGLHWGGGGDANIATNLGDTPLAEFLPANGSTMTFVARHSGKCIDVANNGSADGTNIRTWTCNGTNAQKFSAQSVGAGAVRLVHVGSGKCVDVAAASKENGANVQLYSCNGTGAQAFRLEDIGGYLRVTSANSGLSLDVQDFGTNDGANVQQWGYAGSTNQQFRVNGGCSGVTVYEHTNYGGYAVKLGPGAHPLPTLLGRGAKNDDISSIRVPAGCTAVVYEHDSFGGANATITSDSANLVGSGWNDRLSSLLVF